jgi:hypothetical protein
MNETEASGALSALSELQAHERMTGVRIERMYLRNVVNKRYIPYFPT